VDLRRRQQRRSGGDCRQYFDESAYGSQWVPL
jgi:hypothetical protein